MDGLLDSAETARRLGIKVATLYVYVSRGLIEPHRDPASRRSLFAISDVEQLSQRGQAGRTSDTRAPTITSSVSRITDAGPLYRGVPASGLMDSSFESTADLLWQVDPGAWRALPLRVPEGLHARDAIRCTVAMAGSYDPLRSDRRPEHVVPAGRALIATILKNLASSVDGPGPAPVGERVARWLVGARPDPAVTRATNALLVLLADHEISTSTVAVRLAASTRADLYDAVLAGLGVLGGPLHGANSELAYGVLEDAEARGPAAAIDGALRWSSLLPGFGVVVYPTGDPRFAALRPLLDAVLGDATRAALDGLIDLATANDLPPPNIDLAIAALIRGTGAPPPAGPTIFAIARIAGWIAHYLEELDERALRFRSRAVYVNPSPVE